MSQREPNAVNDRLLFSERLADKFSERENNDASPESRVLYSATVFTI